MNEQIPAPEQPQHSPTLPGQNVQYEQPVDYAQATPQPYMGQTQQAPKGLAIAALVVGIVAFVTGFLPIWGIVLGAVGLILGIIALVKKQPKGFALTGTILSGVALVASLIVTIMVGAATTAVIDVIKEETSVTFESTEPDESQTDADDDSTEGSSEPEAALGTRDNPLPIGETILSKDWEVVINSVNLEANDEVAAANQFNDTPAEGYQYAVVNVTVTYQGEDSSFPAFVGIDYVPSTGEVISTWDSFVVAPQPTFGTGELYTGGSATGNLAFEIPSNVDGVLRVRPGVFADEVFVATQ